MGNILTDENGHILLTNNNALEVTSAIDSNIQPGNIKKDVTILGVTGTYEGSGGGGSAETTFYSCTSTPPTRGSGGAPQPEPGVHITFYVQYPNNNDKIPDMFICYDENGFMTNGNINYYIISDSQIVDDTYYSSYVGQIINIISQTSTLLTLQYNNALPDSSSFDITKFQFAPIYLST